VDYITDQTFEGISCEELTLAEYENCVFKGSSFNKADLSNFTFVDCEFIACDLSSIRSKKTSFRDVYFRDCKLMGIHFEDNSRLIEVDFTEASLEGVSFEGCNLTGSVFQMSNLEKSDFSGAQGFIIDPSNNRMKGAKFSQDGLAGLLTSFGIHIA